MFHYKMLGRNMKRLRLSASLTQKTISEALEYKSPEHWSRVESGERKIPLNKLDAFCVYTNASFEDVLEGATDAHIRRDSAPNRPKTYGERFLEIIADCSDEEVEDLLQICMKIVLFRENRH